MVIHFQIFEDKIFWINNLRLAKLGQCPHRASEICPLCSNYLVSATLIEKAVPTKKKKKKKVLLQDISKTDKKATKPSRK